MIHKLNCGLKEPVYLYVDWEEQDGNYEIEFSYNKKLYNEAECLQIEYHLDKFYEEIAVEIIDNIQNNRK